MDPAYEKVLGQNIRRLRKLRGLSQEQLSARMQVCSCDVTRSALAKIEVGQRHIYPDELKILHDILNVSYDDLFVNNE